MPWLKHIIREFKTAPVASKSLGVERPAKVTTVQSRDEAKRLFEAGLERSRSSRDR
jgi:hypothetical protein